MRAAILILALGLSACNGSTPTAPTPLPAAPVSPLPPTDRIIAMSVLGNQWIATNSGPVQMIARVFTRLASSDGPGEFVDTTEHVTWSVDPAGVVAVDRQGRVTPVANGTALVIATLGQRSASKSVRVLPDYSGTWSGHYIITGCTGAADPRTCSRITIRSDGSRITYPFTVVIAQERDQVTGTLTDAPREFPISGLVRQSGALVIEATLPRSGSEAERIFSWSSTTHASGTQLSGAYSRLVATTVFGSGPIWMMRTEHEFTNLSRTQ